MILSQVCLSFFLSKETDWRDGLAKPFWKADGRRRLRVPKPRKSVFSELPKSSVREVARWVGQPELMRFATVDDTVYGYYGRAFAAVREIAENLPVVRSGIRMGQLFGGRLKPDHALAMFHDLNPEAAPTAVLDREQALDYLRKRETDPALLSEGINRIACDGLTLGWIKRIGNRSNNLYPKELRIATL
jgi:NOL1/NOP2/fmu family ribosome biogenesis protein